MAKYYSYKITRDELRRLLYGEPFGRVTGIIGPFVLRYHNNKLIISDRAVVFNPSQSAGSVKMRGNFSAQSRFAGALNNIEILNAVWTGAATDGISAYHKIFKKNKILNLYPSASNTITPPEAAISNNGFCTFNKDFSININPDSKFNTNDLLLVVAVPYEPYNVSSKPFEVINLLIDASEPELSIRFDEEQSAILKKYRRYVIYSAIIRCSGDTLEWSNTISEEGIIVSEDDQDMIVNAALLFIMREYNYRSAQKTLSTFHTVIPERSG